MRWSVVGLFGIGIVAAVAAAVMVAGLRARARSGGVAATPEVDVVVAAAAIKAPAVLKAEHITTKKVKTGEVPEGCFAARGLVINRVLSVSVAEGQTITQAHLVPEKTPGLIARALEEGKRLVGLPLSRHASLGGVLYPGCLVDILVSFKGQTGRDKGESVAATLLERVPVLAVGDRTVLSPESEDSSAKSAFRRDRIVTVLVDLEQAQLLHLAQGMGDLALALRNPEDEKKVSPKETTVRDLPGHGGPDWLAFATGGTTGAQGPQDQGANAENMEPEKKEPVKKEPEKKEPEKKEPEKKAAQKKPAETKVILIRGSQQETITFPAPAQQDKAGDAAQGR